MKSLVLAAPARALGRRSVALAVWAAPGALLAVLPKCPACFAAYVALWTGIGLAVPVAAGLRWAVMGACVASLGLLVFRLIQRSHARRPHADLEVTSVVCCGRRYDTSGVASPFAGTAGTTGTTGNSVTIIRP